MELTKLKLNVRDVMVLATLLVMLIGLVTPGIFATISSVKCPISYIIEDMGYKCIYSLSPGSSDVVKRTIWTVKVSGNKLENCLFTGEDSSEACFKKAVREIMKIEGVNTVEVKYDKGMKYLALPIRESNKALPAG